MPECKVSIQFVGGSVNGEVIEVTVAPQFHEVTVSEGVKEIYERQSGGPPFVYVQIGYAGNETWT